MRMRLVSAFAGAFAGVSAALISRPVLCRAGSTGALEPRFEAVASRLTALEALERPSRGVVMMGQTEDEPSSTARVIDGKAIAQAIREEIREVTEALVREHGVTPGLAVVLVGSRTDSSTYVRMKKRAAAEVGFYSVDKEFPESVGQEELLACIRALNDDPKALPSPSARACILTQRHSILPLAPILTRRRSILALAPILNLAPALARCWHPRAAAAAQPPTLTLTLTLTRCTASSCSCRCPTISTSPRCYTPTSSNPDPNPNPNPDPDPNSNPNSNPSPNPHLPSPTPGARGDPGREGRRRLLRHEHRQHVPAWRQSAPGAAVHACRLCRAAAAQRGGRLREQPNPNP